MLQTLEGFQRDSDSRHNWAKQALITGVRTAQEQCHGDGPSKTTSQYLKCLSVPNMGFKKYPSFQPQRF